MPGNPPLSLFDARFLLAHGHFIAVPNELIGDPGVDVVSGNSIEVKQAFQALLS
jgi:hypothetical protein